jgi:hypothetical protein
MAPWLIPALKTILPHVATIVSAAAPVFTRRHIEASSEQSRLLQQQIDELQTAAAQNAAHVRELAEQLQTAITALEAAAAAAQRRLQHAVLFGMFATVLSVTAVVLSLAALAG